MARKPETCAWEEISDPTWKPAFAEAKVGAAVRFVGNCPRCNHPTAMDFEPVLPGKGLRAEAEPVDMYCKCSFLHKGRPEQETGCGAYWRIEGTL